MRKLNKIAYLLLTATVAQAETVPNLSILNKSDEYTVFETNKTAKTAEKQTAEKPVELRLVKASNFKVIKDDVKPETKTVATDVKPQEQVDVINESQTKVKLTIKKVNKNDIVKLEKTDPAIEQSKKWGEQFTLMNQAGAKPVLTEDGVVRFPYGEYQPILVCAPMRLCDVELQSGEKLIDVNSSDSVRFLVSSAVSGTAPNLIQHILIKPTDKGLLADLVVTTDKRTYFITMKSSATEYVSRVGFTYPRDEAKARIEKTKQLTESYVAKLEADEKLKQAEVSTKPFSVDNLDFEYSMTTKNNPEFKPLRVFNDGKQVYIQFANEVRTKELPVLTVIDSDGKSQIVNYRMKDNYFLVDRLFNKARVFIGVGDDQQSVDIEWVKNKPKSGGFFSSFGSN